MTIAKSLPLALVAVLTAATSCRPTAPSRAADAKIAACDSIIQLCIDTLSSENILMIEYGVQAEFIDMLHEAYTEKERLLEEHIVEASSGDLKLFLYKEFEREHRLYDAWAEMNDSAVYANYPLSAPWIECRLQRIDRLEEHVRILEKQARPLEICR